MTKSTYSGADSCVEVNPDGDLVVVSDSKMPGPRLIFTHDEWAAFVLGVKAGEFDLPDDAQ